MASKLNQFFFLLILFCQIAYSVSDNHPRKKAAMPELHSAVYRGDLGTIDFLLQQADVDVEVMDEEEQTPLLILLQSLFSCLSEIEEAFDMLVKHGANIFASDVYGLTALHYAAQKGFKNIIARLVLLGADINAKTHAGWTCLHYAVDRNKIDIVKFLLKHEANIDAQTCTQATPLHFAAYSGHVEIVKTLLKHGANIDAIDCRGESSLWKAIHTFGYDCYVPPRRVITAKILIQKGAKLDIKNVVGWKFEEYANRFSSSQITALLESALHGPR